MGIGLTALVFFAVPPAFAAPPPGSAHVSATLGSAKAALSLAFSDVSVREVLMTIAGYAGVDILLTPGVQGRITISLRHRTSDEAIRLVAAADGLSVARPGGAYIVGPEAEVRQAVAQFEPPVAARSVVTLKQADPDSAARVLGQAYPDLRVAREGQTLVLSGLPDDLTAARQTLQSVDVATPELPIQAEVAVYHLNYLNADRATASLKSVLPNLTVAPAPEPTAPPAGTLNTIAGGFQSTTGGSGGSSGGSGSGNSSGGTNGGGAADQILSRATRLILIGIPADVATAQSLLDQTDIPQPLVRIEAALVEINRDDITNLGLRFDYSNGGFAFSTPGGTVPPTVSGLGISGGGGNFTGLGHVGPNNFAFTLQALVNQNHARILASPNISVVDNEDASVFIGDTIRFPGATTVTTGGTTITSTEAVPVGIALVVRPHVHPDGEVTLKIHPAVSSVTGFTQGLPQISSREADTTVRLHYGEEFVIGGLLNTQELTAIDKVPLLGDIPILGELFRNRRIERQRREIVVIIRAYPTLTDPAPVHDFRQNNKDQNSKDQSGGQTQ